jgi:hypothetical protein
MASACSPAWLSTVPVSTALTGRTGIMPVRCGVSWQRGSIAQWLHIRQQCTCSVSELTLVYVRGMRTRQLSNLLAHNTTVHNLDLRETLLGPDGARHIARMLMTNTRLETLDLASNAIEDEGATAVARALKDNPNVCLVKLELQRNGISSGPSPFPLAPPLPVLAAALPVPLSRWQHGTDI